MIYMMPWPLQLSPLIIYGTVNLVFVMLSTPTSGEDLNINSFDSTIDDPILTEAAATACSTHIVINGFVNNFEFADAILLLLIVLL